VAGYGALLFVCLVLAAVTFVVIAAPTDFIRDQLVQQVKQRTGRDLVVAGPVSTRFFPSLGVRLEDVTLSNAAGGEGANIAIVKAVDVEVRAWSLLSRHVTAKRVVLHGPAIDLSVDAQGRRNWAPAVEAAAGGASPARDAGSAPLPAAGRDGDAAVSPGLPALSPKLAASLDKLGLGQLRIVDGTVRYKDARTGTNREIGSLALDFRLRDPDAPLQATGSGVWRGEKISVEAGIDSLRRLLEGQPTHANIAVTGRPFAVRYAGTLGTGGVAAAEGNINMTAPSLDALAAWLGDTRIRGGAGPFSLSATLAGTAEGLSVGDLEVAAGDVNAQGNVTIANGAERPRVEGRLRLSELDLGKVLVRADGTSAPSLAVRPAGEATALPAAPGEPRANAASGTAVPRHGKGLSGRDWSDQAFDVAALGLADADLQLSVDRLAYRDVQTGPARLAVALKDKVATLTLQDMQLYGGQGRGVLTLHGTGESLASEVQLVISGASIQPLLKDTLHVEWLDGRGALNLVLAGRGLSERQMMAGLSGRVLVTLANGSVAGIDVSKIVHNLEAGQLSGLGPAPEDKTRFDELAATFVIADGIARNQDLRLTSSHLTVAGAGTVNLPLRQLDYTVRPKIVSAAGAAPVEPGKGGGIDLSGLEIPVHIAGPWDKPAFTPDLKGVLASDQAKQAIKRIGRNLKSQEVQDALRGLLSGDREQRVKPRDLIEKLLKKE
jgi:AsmA protein